MATVKNSYGYLNVTMPSVYPEEVNFEMASELDFFDYYAPEEAVYAAYWEAYFKEEPSFIV